MRAREKLSHVKLMWTAANNFFFAFFRLFQVLNFADLADFGRHPRNYSKSQWTFEKALSAKNLLKESQKVSNNYF